MANSNTMTAVDGRASSSGWIRDFGSFSVLATTALCAGLLINQFRDKPLSLLYQSKTERLQQAVARLGNPETPPSAVSLPSGSLKEIGLEEFKEFVAKKSGVIIDARPEIFHRFGHVAGALSLPRDDFENGYKKIKGALEASRNLPVAIYCADSSCEDGLLVQKGLTALGYTQLSLFRGGWASWIQAGLPEEKSP